MSNLVEIIVSAKNLTGPTMAAVNAEVSKTSKGMALFHKTTLAAAAGFVAIGVESVKMASKFDSEMTLLQTQAGVSADKIDGLKKGVLSLAGKVGQDPDSLAESLFHVESNFESMGISSAKALKLTETAAKGATVGHAGLVDVTNALTAAVAANIPGVQNMDQAMGVLNATVGIGDMKMQDLAAAFGTGMVATVKGYGLSIKDVAAGLAVFGDNNIRGAKAGTQLRMSVQSLAQQGPPGVAALKSIGIESGKLAKDMQQGGLKLALEDLVAHMKAAGLSSKEQGQLITDAFGKKAGTGLNILVDQMGRLESKYPALDEGAKNFGKSWADTQKTFAFQVKALQASFDALMIGIGEKIIPPLQSFIHLLAAHKRATIDATVATAGLLAGMVALSVAMKTAAGVKLAWSALAAGATLAKSAMETAALKMMYMQEASIAAGGGLKGLSAAFGTLSKGAKLGVAVVAIGAIVLALEKLNSSNKQVRISSDDLARSLESGLTRGAATSPVIDNLRQAMQGLVKETDDTAGAWDKFSYSFTHWGAKFSSSASSAKAQANDLRDLGKAVGQIAQDKGVDTATKALAMLAKQGAKIPTKDLKDYNNALADQKIQSDITASAQGRFGKQAQAVQQQLKAQKDVADGLAQSLQALDQVNQDAYSSETKFYDSISGLTKSMKDNGRTLDVHTEKGRNNRDAIVAAAAATDDYTAKLTAQKASWSQIDAAYKQGYDSLVKFAQGAGYGREQAEKLASSLLHVPKEVVVRGQTSDLTSKLSAAKRQLAGLPKSKTTRGNFAYRQALADVRFYERALAVLDGKQVTVSINTVKTSVNAADYYSQGPHKAAGGFINGPGSGTSDDVPIMASNGEFVVNAKAAQAHRGLLEALNSGRHGIAAFAKGGKVTKAQQAAIDRANAEREARGEALGHLSLSYFGQAAGYKRSGFTSSTSTGAAGIDDLVGTLTDWRAKIRAATHGAQESKLIRDFDRFGAAALRNEKALTAVNSKLSAASDKLSALKDAASQLKDSVSSGIVSGGSIAKGGPGNALGVLETLQGSVDSAKRFAADLARLKRSGLNKQSLSELGQAGVDGGLGTADALSGASPAYIKRINALEKQLLAAGASAGGTASNAMYGAGIKSAEGIVAGLKKQQSRLDAIMAHAAAAMAAELRRALGRKAAGGTVGAAASGGNRWGRTLVGEYGPEIADLPVGTRVHSAPDSARMLGSSAPVQPIALTVVIGGTTVGTALIDPLRKEIRHQGGNVQLVLGVKGK